MWTISGQKNKGVILEYVQIDKASNNISKPVANLLFSIN